MSLLEDVFLEDEAGEAQALERVIDGDEYDERPRSVASNSDDNSEKEDEAAEDKIRVDPANAKPKRSVNNPRFVLNPARLTGPRGIQVIPDHFKDFKFKGKGHEKENLDLVLKKLEHWAYRLYPKFQFEDCLKKIETLGKKRPVMVHLHKIRSDQFLNEETVVQRDSSDDEAPAPLQEEDEFDKLLQQQIELARATPAPGSVTKTVLETSGLDKRSPLIMPKATSSPSISDEQRDRMIKNRQLAEERRVARLKQNTNSTSLATVDLTNINSNTSEETRNDAIDTTRKHNRSNIIESSDDEDSDKATVDETATAIHNNYNKNLIDLTQHISLRSTTSIIEVPKITTNETRMTHNRSNIIYDSSDDEVGISTINEVVTVDIQHNSDKNQVCDLTVLEVARSILNEPTIDLVGTDDKRITKHNVNDDSSDEEIEMTTVNEAITVDVHNNSNKNRVLESKLEKDENKTSDNFNKNCSESDLERFDLIEENVSRNEDLDKVEESERQPHNDKIFSVLSDNKIEKFEKDIKINETATQKEKLHEVSNKNSPSVNRKIIAIETMDTGTSNDNNPVNHDETDKIVEGNVDDIAVTTETNNKNNVVSNVYHNSKDSENLMDVDFSEDF